MYVYGYFRDVCYSVRNNLTPHPFCCRPPLLDALEKNRESKVQSGGERRPDGPTAGHRGGCRRGRGRGSRRRERRRRRDLLFPSKATHPRRGGCLGAVADRHHDVVDTGVREGCSHVGRGEGIEREINKQHRETCKICVRALSSRRKEESRGGGESSRRYKRSFFCCCLISKLPLLMLCFWPAAPPQVLCSFFCCLFRRNRRDQVPPLLFCPYSARSPAVVTYGGWRVHGGFRDVLDTLPHGYACPVVFRCPRVLAFVCCLRRCCRSRARA